MNIIFKKFMLYCFAFMLFVLASCKEGSSGSSSGRGSTTSPVQGEFVLSAMPPGAKHVCKVALLIYNPVNPNNPNQKLYDWWDYHDPDLLAEETMREFELASNGWLDIQIVDRIEVPDFPEHEDGFKYKWSDWVDANGNGDIDTPLTTSPVSYVKFLQANGLPARIDAKEIDLVWYFAPAGIGVSETVMGGKGSFWINGWIPGGTALTKRRFVVAWFNVGHAR